MGRLALADYKASPMTGDGSAGANFQISTLVNITPYILSTTNECTCTYLISNFHDAEMSMRISLP